MTIDQKLLEILICPQSGAELQYDEKNQELICQESKLAYKIVGGIPVMLIDEARRIDEE
jgi:uncharacterized protein